MYHGLCRVRLSPGKVPGQHREDLSNKNRICHHHTYHTSAWRIYHLTSLRLTPNTDINSTNDISNIISSNSPNNKWLYHFPSTHYATNSLQGLF
jgi:hypothetical protein